jgi:acyl-CoA thioesterase-1
VKRNHIVPAVIVFLTACSLVIAQIKIVLVGDSITWDRGYPEALQSLLGPGYIVVNLAASGQTMNKSGDQSYWVTDRFPQVFSSNPDIIVIMLGVNDSKPYNWQQDNKCLRYKSDYLAMIDTFSTIAAKPKIFPALCTPCFKPEGWDVQSDTLRERILPIIREIAVERGLSLIDAYTPLVNHPEYFVPDGVHPDSAGADSIAHAVYRSVSGGCAVALSDSLLKFDYTFGAAQTAETESILIRHLSPVKPGVLDVTPKSTWLTAKNNAVTTDSQIITISLDPTGIPDVPGVYFDTVKITDPNVAYSPVFFQVQLSIHPSGNETPIQLMCAAAFSAQAYCGGILFRGNDAGVLQITLTDANGRTVVHTMAADAGNFSYKTMVLSSGIYYLTVNTLNWDRKWHQRMMIP